MDNPNDLGFNVDTSDTNKEFVKSKDCYYVIKQMFLDFIPETQFPSYEEWTEMVDKDELHDPTLVDFKPGSGASSGLPKRGLAGRVGAAAFSAARFAYASGSAEEILESMRTRAEEAIRRRANKTGSKPFERFTKSSKPGNGEVSLNGSRFNPEGLSQTLKPIETNFKTDITFQGQTRYWQDGKENSGPLFIKAGVPGLISREENSHRDTQMWDFIKGPVTMEWNSAIANKVTWTGRVKDLLTEQQITDYINRCLSACSVYYFWRSVIKFTDDARNRNAGMDALRDRLTPSDYNNLWNLRRELMQTSIPPFIHEFCFYMFGTYRQNDLPTSPIMKLMPFAFASTNDNYFTGEIALVNGESGVDLARGHLYQLREFNNILSRAIGDWGGVEPFEYTSSPRVDQNFTTFWTNANYVATNATGTIDYPRIESSSEELVYNIHTDDPDGWISSMVSPFDAVSGDFGVGLFHAWNLTKLGTSTDGAASLYLSNKVSSCFMYNADGTAGFYPVELSQRFQSLSGNTYNTLSSSGTYHKFQRFGTERVILTSVNALRQANFQFLELLYTQDLRNIKSSPGIRKGVTVSASKGSKSPYGGRKRGGKSRRSDPSEDESLM